MRARSCFLRSLVWIAVLGAAGCSATSDPAGSANPVEASVLVSQIPPDVDTAEQARLTKAGSFPQVQRLFDELSWRTFIALSWPVDAQGQPRSGLNDAGQAFWETYSESYEVYKADGSAPDPYGAARTTLPPIDEMAEDGGKVLGKPGHRVLFNQSAVDNLTVLDETLQAFSIPLWDQNGNAVHYEVLLNESEYDYLKANELYNLDGQVDYYEAHGNAEFPAGVFGGDDVGAIELKLAWRILTANDIPERYVVRDAFVIAGSPPAWTEVKAGLVGMHVSHKTKSSPQWVWSTFEHVDNLRVNDFEAFGPGSAGHPSRPSFNNPDCEYCPINVPPEPDAEGVLRTQVSRVVPIPKATESYNAEVQALLRAQGSPLQYYELINTQWPTDPDSPPAEVTDYPSNITNKSGGKPTPVFLINAVMETYFQGGASSSNGAGKPEQVTLGVVEEGAAGAPSYTVPSTNGGNTPLNLAEGFCHSVGTPCGEAGDHLVLSTESCMGCHSSATIATAPPTTPGGAYAAGNQLSADFSWLLTQKAHPRSAP